MEPIKLLLCILYRLIHFRIQSIYPNSFHRFLTIQKSINKMFLISKDNSHLLILNTKHIAGIYIIRYILYSYSSRISIDYYLENNLLNKLYNYINLSNLNTKDGTANKGISIYLRNNPEYNFQHINYLNFIFSNLIRNN